MPGQATAVSPQTLIDTAKGPFLAYNDKNWEKIKTLVTSNFIYDEVATRRRVEGVDACLQLWKGWAQAFPDSKATFHDAYVSGDTVVLELTWKGTHSGALQTPGGNIPATGKRIEIRACNVVELSGEKSRLQRQYFDMATMMEQLGVKA